MVRDYKALLRSDRVPVPRWVISCFVFLMLVWFGLRIMIPPSWIVQRLDSMDGTKSAVLMRRQYLRQNLSVHVKQGLLWRSAFHSQPITNDFRIDLGERLLWSHDSNRLFLEVQGKVVWGYDFEGDRDLGVEEIRAAFRASRSDDL